jgi:CheY-like chemotaxis protein
MVDDIVKLIDAATKLVSVVAWPLVVIIAFRHFAPPLQTFLRNLKEGTFEAPGIKFSGKSQAEATAAIANASVAHLDLSNLGPDASRALQAQISQSVAASARAVDALTSVSPQGTNQIRQILWVDDRPANNAFETQAFEKLGFNVTNALSTADALDHVEKRKYDLIISDMARPEGARAGFDLVSRLREQKVTVPLIIYSSANTPEMRAEATRLGAFGSTNRPDELLHLAADALTRPDGTRGSPTVT